MTDIMKDYRARIRRYMAVVRSHKEHAVSVVTDSDVFYLRCTKKQAAECVRNGMVATVNEHGLCLCVPVDYDAEFRA